jgi:hypothetical protein
LYDVTGTTIERAEVQRAQSYRSAYEYFTDESWYNPISLEPIARGRDRTLLPAGIGCVVERSFSELARYRRLNTVFDRTKEHLIAFVQIAFISIFCRRLKRLVTRRS